MAFDLQDEREREQMLNYTASKCGMEHSSLEEAESCQFAHNGAEVYFHPALYLTEKCVIPEHYQILTSSDSAIGTRLEICPFFHQESESRKCASTEKQSLPKCMPTSIQYSRADTENEVKSGDKQIID